MVTQKKLESLLWHGWQLLCVLTILLCLTLSSVLCAKSPSKQVMVVGLFSGKAVVIINNKQFLLRANGKMINGVQLLSSNSERAVLLIDGQREVLTADTAAGSIGQAVKQTKKVQIWANQQGMYLVQGRINGAAASFMVDTGATYVVMSSVEAQRLNINYKQFGRLSRAATASGIVATYNLEIDKLTIGSIYLRHVKVAIIEGKHPQRILLGMSYLSRIRMESKGRSLMLIQH
ncbi:hypothetical protein MNBD_GAMMA12-1067 [hydrothermal vent metagenome]|uniref:TIGR02281 family clan AA aspartic protease n=1 Tax=hydrothermal vent metagenome TaxID=652676 RepID=A0A3B0YMX1_9ZZZZ